MLSFIILLSIGQEDNTRMKSFRYLLAVTITGLAFSQPGVGQHHDEHEGMQGMSMVHVTITHEVEDPEHWLAAWRGEDSRHKLFEDNGAMHVHTLQSADNPNLTGLVVAVADMDKFMAMLESEEGQAAAIADGVKLDTMVLLVETK